jgi:branched-chain amino acid transport system ATP-binding protein
LLRAVREAASDRNVGVLLVEQHVRQALEIADRVYVLQRGRVVLEGTASEISGRAAELESAYLAGAAPPSPNGSG